MNRGFSQYEPMPSHEALRWSIDERLRNNLPRYESQADKLTDFGTIDVTHLGLVLTFSLSNGGVALKVIDGAKSAALLDCHERLPILPWRRKSTLMRFMARQEMTLWP
jgi:hypothetical protein